MSYWSPYKTKHDNRLKFGVCLKPCNRSYTQLSCFRIDRYSQILVENQTPPAFNAPVESDPVAIEEQLLSKSRPVRWRFLYPKKQIKFPIEEKICATH